jgi:hypothetical protein
MEDVIKKWDKILKDDNGDVLYSHNVVKEMLYDFKKSHKSNPIKEEESLMEISEKMYKALRIMYDGHPNKGSIACEEVEAAMNLFNKINKSTL